MRSRTRYFSLHFNRNAIRTERYSLASVCTQRIVDYLPLLIEHELNQSLASQLPGSLFRSFLEGADAAAKMKQLLSEDPAISMKRQLLEGKIARLTEIKQKLDVYV